MDNLTLKLEETETNWSSDQAELAKLETSIKKIEREKNELLQVRLITFSRSPQFISKRIMIFSVIGSTTFPQHFDFGLDSVDNEILKTCRGNITN